MWFMGVREEVVHRHVASFIVAKLDAGERVVCDVE